MKKPYFVRYKEVSGTLVKGDSFLRSDGIIETYTGGDYGDFHPSALGFPKVELFLFSRDIKFGDTVYRVSSYSGNDSGVIGKQTSNGCFWLEGEDYDSRIPRHSPNNWGRVVGQISKDATWVESGNQLDDDDILIEYGTRVVKKYRNGEVSTVLTFNYHPSAEMINNEAVYWAEHIDIAGHNHGYEIIYDTG